MKYVFCHYSGEMLNFSCRSCLNSFVLSIFMCEINSVLSFQASFVMLTKEASEAHRLLEVRAGTVPHRRPWPPRTDGRCRPVVPQHDKTPSSD